MSGFGDRLKRERESRNTSLADVARRTRIGIQYLEALERGDFDGLPGRRGFGKLYIRVYAELFGFDPEPVISEYDQERLEQEPPDEADSPIEPELPRRVRSVQPARGLSSAEPGTRTPAPPVEESAPDDPASVPRQATQPSVPSAAPRGASMTGGAPSWKRWIAGGAVALLVLGAFGVTLKMRTSHPIDSSVPESPAATGFVTPSAGSGSEGDDAGIGEDAAGGPGVRPPSADSRVTPVSPVAHDPPPVSTAPAGVRQRPADSRHLEVAAFELGTGVVDLRVVDPRREFEEGTVASFLTRVRGGAPGRSIHHAWIREGRLIQSIELHLGSPDWRTYSRKTLWARGDWAVEARDETGRVLARIEFRCLPSSGPRSGG